MKLIKNRRILQGAVQNLSKSTNPRISMVNILCPPMGTCGKNIERYQIQRSPRSAQSHVFAIDTRSNGWSLEKQSTGVGRNIADCG